MHPSWLRAVGLARYEAASAASETSDAQTLSPLPPPSSSSALQDSAVKPAPAKEAAGSLFFFRTSYFGTPSTQSKSLLPAAVASNSPTAFFHATPSSGASGNTANSVDTATTTNQQPHLDGVRCDQCRRLCLHPELQHFHGSVAVAHTFQELWQHWQSLCHPTFASPMGDLDSSAAGGKFARSLGWILHSGYSDFAVCLVLGVFMDDACTMLCIFMANGLLELQLQLKQQELEALQAFVATVNRFYPPVDALLVAVDPSSSSISPAAEPSSSSLSSVLLPPSLSPSTSTSTLPLRADHFVRVAGPISDGLSSDSSGTYPFQGHPNSVVRSLTDALAVHFLAGIPMDGPGTRENHFEKVLSRLVKFMLHCEILARFPLSHHVFWRHGCLLAMLDFMSTGFLHAYLPLVAELREIIPRSADWAGDGTRRRVVCKDLLESILVSFLQAIQHLFDPDLLWKGWLLTWSLDLPSRSVDESEPLDSSWITKLMEMIRLVMDALGSRTPSSKDYVLLMHCLNTLGSLLLYRHASQLGVPSMLRSSAYMECLVRLIRVPLFLQLNLNRLVQDHDDDWRHRRDKLRLRNEFRLQVLALHVILFAMMDRSTLANPPDYHALVSPVAQGSGRLIQSPSSPDDVGLKDRLVVLFYWVAVCSGGFDSDEESYVGLNCFPLIPSMQTDIVTGTRMQQLPDTLSEDYAHGTILDPQNALLKHGVRRKRLVSREAFIETPIASQELDLLFRLWASYLVHDLKAFAQASVSGSVAGQAPKTPWLKQWLWTWLLRFLRSLFDPSTGGSGQNGFAALYLIVWPKSNSYVAFLPSLQFYGLEAMSRCLTCQFIENAPEIQTKMIQLLLHELTEIHLWELLLGDLFCNLRQRLMDRAKSLTWSGDLEDLPLASISMDDRVFPMRYMLFLSDALNHRAWWVVEKCFTMEHDSVTNRQLCTLLFQALDSAYSTLPSNEHSQHLCFTILRTLRVALECNGNLVRHNILNMNDLSNFTIMIQNSVQQTDFRSSQRWLLMVLDLLDLLLLPERSLGSLIVRDLKFAEFVSVSVYSSNSAISRWGLKHIVNLLEISLFHVAPAIPPHASPSSYAVLSLQNVPKTRDVFDAVRDCLQPSHLAVQENINIILELLQGLERLFLRFFGNNVLHARFGDPDMFTVMLDLVFKGGETLPSDRWKPILLQIIRLLTLVFAGLAVNKRYFRSIGGYRSLSELMSRHSIVKDDRDIMLALFNMMLDRYQPDGPLSLEFVRNPLAFETLIRLYPCWSLELRLVFLDQLLTLLNVNLNVIALSSESTRWAQKILDLIIPVMREKNEIRRIESILIKMLEHSIDVHSLKALIGSLQIRETPSDFEPALPIHFMSVLRVISAAASAPPTPAALFSFSGCRSGLALPPSDGLFVSSGLTFGIWFRIESLNGEMVSKRQFSLFDQVSEWRKGNYAPRLLSILNESLDTGLELVIEDYTLLLIMVTPSGVQSHPTPFEIITDKWFQLFLIYQPAKKLSLSKGTMSIVVNGQERAHWKMDLPPSGFYSHCSVFGRFVSHEGFVKTRFVQTKRNSSQPISTSDNYSLAGEVSSFWMIRKPTSIAECLDAYRKGFSFFNIPLSNLSLDTSNIDSDGDVIFHFHPCAFLESGAACLNLAPSKLGSKNPPVALLRGGLVSIRQTIPQLLTASGGIRIWLHLIDKLPVIYKMWKRLQSTWKDDGKDRHPANELFESLAAQLRNNAVNLKDALDGKIFQLIGFLLRRPECDFIPNSIFQSFDIVLDTVKSSSDLYNLALRHLILDFRVWSNAKPDIKVAQFDYLASLLKKDSRGGDSVLSIQDFLRALLTEFEVSHANNREIQSITDLLDCMVRKNPCSSIPHVVSAILYALANKPPLVLILLRLMLSWSEDSSNEGSLLSEKLWLSMGPNYEVFGVLFLQAQIRVQCITLKIFTNLSDRVRGLKARVQSEPITFAGLLNLIELGCPFERDHFDVLLNAALKEKSCPTNGQESGKKIEFTAFVIAFLRLMPSCKTDELTLLILDSLIEIFETEYEFNCHLMRRSSDWLLSLVEFISTIETDGSPEKYKLKNRAIQLLSVLLSYVLRIDGRGWAFVEEAALGVWLRHRGRWKGMLLAREITGQVLQTVLRFSANSPKPSDIEKDNLSQLVRFVEDLVFYYHDMSGVVKRFMASQSSLQNDRSTGGITTLLTQSQSSLASAENDSFWDGGEIIDWVMQVVENKGIMSNFVPKSDGDEHGRPGGVFRIMLRLCLWGLLSSNGSLCSRSSKLLNRIMNDYSIGPNNENEENVAGYLKQDQNRKILYIMGSVHQSFMSTKTLPGGSPLELLSCYRSLVNRWRILLAAYQIDLASKEFSNDEAFVAFIESTPWNFVYDTHFVPAMKFIEEECASIGEVYSRRYENFVKVADLKRRRAEQADNEQKVVLLDKANRLRQELVDSLVGRFAEETNREESEDEALTYQWVQASRVLRGPTGIWAAINSEELHWKLDSSENLSRMRRKLAHNYFFRDHVDASLKRDKSDLTAVQESPSIRLPISRKKMLDSLTESPGGKVLNKQISDITMLSVDSGGTPPFEDGEEWDFAETVDDHTASTASESVEKFMYSVQCNLIVLMSVVLGRLELTNKFMTFIVDQKAALNQINDFDRAALIYDGDTYRNRKWAVTQISEIHARRHLLQSNALEFFFKDRSNFLFSFPKGERKRLYQKLMHMKLPNLLVPIMNPIDYMKRSNITERWVNKEMSNFDYLMVLNTLAGRTFNDLTQYPVFPWVLSDYSSSDLDLSKPESFRDLSKPIGALNEKRLHHFLERYHSFSDPSGIPKFHYGTHYSSAATVLFYLLRLEPFTSLHIALQNGKFDHADRQFHDLASTWRSCLENTGDVRELIPEFFYFPEFLTNSNHFDLGLKQVGDRLNNIILPPWAKGSPETFVRLHRRALESDYVSSHLHQWVDLIFGYKQRGDESIKAHNVFYYLTYEGSVDLDTIQDPVERKSIESQISNFGQTPFQLFDRPHPKRQMSQPSELDRNLIRTPNEHQSFVVHLQRGQLKQMSCLREENDEVFLGLVSDRGSDTARWAPMTANTNTEIPFNFQTSTPAKQSKEVKYRQRHLSASVVSADRYGRSPYLFSRDGKFQFSGGHWDWSLKVSLLETGRVLEVIRGHRGLVTCMDLSSDERVLVTGSADATLLVWDVSLDRGSRLSAADPSVQHTKRCCLIGHDEAILSVALDQQHSTIVSTSMDGSVMFSCLRSGNTLLRMSLMDAILRQDADLSSTYPLGRDHAQCLAHQVIMSNQADVIVYTETRHHDLRKPIQFHLHRLDVNGRYGTSIRLSNRLTSMNFDFAGTYLLVADDTGMLAIHETFLLGLVHRFDIGKPAVAMHLTRDHLNLLVGRLDGSLMVIMTKTSAQQRSQLTLPTSPRASFPSFSL